VIATHALRRCAQGARRTSRGARALLASPGGERTMNHAFVREVAERAGLTETEARAALTATWRALSPALPVEVARRLRAALPDEAGALVGSDAPRELDEEAFYAAVTAAEGAPRAFGREHAQAVAEAAGGWIDPGLREELERCLAPSLGARFEPRAAPSTPAPPAHHAARTTLAEGRPGSRHPLADARPEPAQEHSVARNEDPHRATKLSSASGLTQERQRDALATGRPGPRRPISEG
jgi:uncharacterized protein (DUF2267 family)